MVSQLIKFPTQGLDSKYPFLEVHEPDGGRYTLDLGKLIENNQNRVTIGRDNDNDIVLPDPQKNVSRSHCFLEREGSYWRVVDGVDKVSANGTFVRKGNSKVAIDVRKKGRVLLKDGDAIEILGKVEASDRFLFWKLIFLDADATNPVSKAKPPAPTESDAESHAEYSLCQETLFRNVKGQVRERIYLNPQERKLIHYMAQRNQANNQPVVCTYKELISAIWGEQSFDRVSDDIIHTVWRIRRKLEFDPGEPQFLETVRSKGYILRVTVLS